MAQPAQFTDSHPLAELKLSFATSFASERANCLTSMYIFAMSDNNACKAQYLITVSQAGPQACSISHDGPMMLILVSYH